MAEPVHEGMIKKGGQNPPVPTTHRPAPPKGSKGTSHGADGTQASGLTRDANDLDGNLQDFLSASRRMGRQLMNKVFLEFMDTLTVDDLNAPRSISVRCNFCKEDKHVEITGGTFDGMLSKGWAASFDGVAVCPECLKGWAANAGVT